MIYFAPDLCDGRWVPVDVMAGMVFVVGAALGFLYGLPAIDPDALKAAGAASGTFLRPSTKLDKIIDTLLPVGTGALVTYAATQGARFSVFFQHMSGLPQDSASRLLGVAILGFFGPLGFMLAYPLTATIGALTFKYAEEALVEGESVIERFTPLPDLPTEPSEEQKAAAIAVAKIPYASLTNAQQKAVWARAQTLLEHYSLALRAYQDAIALDPQNAGLLVDYAITLYNDPDTKNIGFVLQLLDDAENTAGASASESLRQRMNALRAVAMLYQPAGYVATIYTVNTWIQSGVPTTKLARYYRACAFGQLYEACASTVLPSQPPYVLLDPKDDGRLKFLVHSDIAITLVVAKGTGREQVRMVIDPTSPTRGGPADDDLQMLAADDPILAAQAGLSAPPPPPPPPHPLLPPVAAAEPSPARVPLPNPLQDPGALATWIDKYCPT